MFELGREYVFFKRVLSSRRFTDELGKESIEPVFVSVAVEKGVVTAFSLSVLSLKSGVELSIDNFDFALPVVEGKEDGGGKG